VNDNALTVEARPDPNGRGGSVWLSDGTFLGQWHQPPGSSRWQCMDQYGTDLTRHPDGRERHEEDVKRILTEHAQSWALARQAHN